MPAPDGADAPLTSEDDLLAIFREAASPRERWRIGVEHEKLGVRADGTPVGPTGVDGVDALLGHLEQRGYRAKREGERTIALGRETERWGDEAITIEPGGQIEMSGPPLATATDCGEHLRAHAREVIELARPLGIRFISGGFRPFGTLGDVPWFVKRRYEVMRAYMPGAGSRGLEMMKRTATAQVNLDFADEANAAEKLRAALGVTSLVTALYAASPVSEGRPNGFRSYRAHVWLDTDETRCGILPCAFEPGFDVGRYVQWALDAPMFFVARAGRYHAADRLPFRAFLRDGFARDGVQARATPADWELHLSTLFPEVRLKRTIELRGADAAPLPLVLALPALWRGLLDDRGACAVTSELVAAWSLDDRERVRREVPVGGLTVEVGGRPLSAWARELVEVAGAGLRRLPGGEADAALLEPLRELAAAGRCPADEMLETLARRGPLPQTLIDAWELRP
jgi:glutamate--cysteine ligase